MRWCLPVCLLLLGQVQAAGSVLEDRVRDSDYLSGIIDQFSPSAVKTYRKLCDLSEQQTRMLTPFEFGEVLGAPPERLTMDDYSYLFFVVVQAQKPEIGSRDLSTLLNAQSSSISSLKLRYRAEIFDDEVLDDTSFNVFACNGSKLFRWRDLQPATGKASMEMWSYDGSVVRQIQRDGPDRHSPPPVSTMAIGSVTPLYSPDSFFSHGNPLRLLGFWELKKRFGCGLSNDTVAELARQVVWEVPAEINGHSVVVVGQLENLYFVDPARMYCCVHIEHMRYRFSEEAGALQEADRFDELNASEFINVGNETWLPQQIEWTQTVDGEEYRIKTTVDEWSVNEPIEESLFTDPFPENTYVIDVVNDKQFVNKPFEIEPQTGVPEGTGRPGWLMMLNIGIIGLAIVALSLRIMMRKQADVVE